MHRAPGVRRRSAPGSPHRLWRRPAVPQCLGRAGWGCCSVGGRGRCRVSAWPGAPGREVAAQGQHAPATVSAATNNKWLPGQLRGCAFYWLSGMPVCSNSQVIGQCRPGARPFPPEMLCAVAPRPVPGLRQQRLQEAAAPRVRGGDGRAVPCGAPRARGGGGGGGDPRAFPGRLGLRPGDRRCPWVGRVLLPHGGGGEP